MMTKRTTISSMTTMNNRFSRKALDRIGYGLIFLSVIGLDQYGKFLCRKDLAPIGSYELIPGVFRLTYCENSGAAFSFLAGKTWFFILTTVILCGGILYLLIRDRVRTRWGKIAAICVLSGGVGNLIDRIATGYVVDMFDFYLIRFAVFNVADIFVTCGCILFVAVFLFSKGKVLDL